jgi:hypothetical protein
MAPLEFLTKQAPLMQFEPKNNIKEITENEMWSSSPDRSISKYQVFDTVLAGKLVKSESTTFQDKKKIKNMLTGLRPKGFLVHYKHSGSAKGTDMKGRWYSCDSGLSCLSRDVRNSLASKYYWDVDIVNCQPTILEQFARRNGWVCNFLSTYNNNREAYLKLISDDRDEAKKAVIALFFGQRRKDLPTFFLRLQEELEILVKNLQATHSHLTKKVKNGALSITALVLQDEEAKCLNAIDTALAEKGRSFDVLIHDGGLLRKLDGEKEVSAELLQYIEARIYERTGYNVNVKVKPMTNVFEDLTDPTVPDGNSYNDIKIEFEKNHFKVMNPFMYCRVLESGDLQVFDRKRLKDAYENKYFVECVKGSLVNVPFITKWVTDPNINTREKIDFLPPPLKCPDNVYNLYRGLRAETLDKTTEEDGLKAVLTHVRRLCGGSGDCYNYFIKWLAYKVQFPALLPRVALCFQSEQGSGKNLFWDFFGEKVLGKQYYHISPSLDSLIGKFAEGLKHRLCVVLDETSGKDTFSCNEILKSVITNAEIEYEKKFCPKISMTNCASWVFLTNNQVPVKIEYSDRRFVIFSSMNDRLNDPSYFDPLVEQLNKDSTARAFYDFLMKQDVEKFNFVNTRPKTEAYLDIQEASLPSVAWFVKHLIDGYTVEVTEMTYSSKKLYELFCEWCDANKRKSDMNNISFAIHIKKWLGNSTEDNNKSRKDSCRNTTVNKERVLALFRQRGVLTADGF